MGACLRSIFFSANLRGWLGRTRHMTEPTYYEINDEILDHDVFQLNNA